MVSVDTPVWSPSSGAAEWTCRLLQRHLTQTLYQLIRQRNVQLLGATRQEVLSGIREESEFRRIRDHLRGFQNVELDSEDYEEADRISHDCRQHGIADSSVDMLMCALSLRHRWEIFTTDRDFIDYARVVPLQMLIIR